MKSKSSLPPTWVYMVCIAIMFAAMIIGGNNNETHYQRGYLAGQIAQTIKTNDVLLDKGMKGLCEQLLNGVGEQ